MRPVPEIRNAAIKGLKDRFESEFDTQLEDALRLNKVDITKIVLLSDTELRSNIGHAVTSSMNKLIQLLGPDN